MTSPEPIFPSGSGKTWTRRILPWLIAASILGWLLRRVPMAEVAIQLRSGPHLLLFAYIFVACAAIVLADGWATGFTLARCGVQRPLGEWIAMRGALNIAGVLHLAAVHVLFGFYLNRHVGNSRRSAALVALVFLTQMGALVLLGSGSLWLPSHLPGSVRLFFALAIGGYLAAVFLLPHLRGLLQRAGIDPADHSFTPANLLAATAARLVHAAVLVGGLWGGLRLWGIEVPLIDGLFLLPLTILAAGLPVTPGGIGTTQAAMVWLFSTYGPASSTPANEAAVLTFSLLWTTYGLFSQFLLGLTCLALLPKGFFDPPSTGS